MGTFATLPRNNYNNYHKPLSICISVDVSSLKVFVTQMQCEPAIVPDKFYSSSYGFPLPKGSAYKPFFDAR